MVKVANAQLADHFTDSLYTRSSAAQQWAIYNLHKSGKDAIPLLISEMDRPESVFVQLTNPVTSFSHPEWIKFCPVGMLHAYIIELILANPLFRLDATSSGALSPLPNPRLDSLRESGYAHATSPLGTHPANYLFESNVIVSKRGDLISQSDMHALRRIYEEWWRSNKNKSLDRLRTDYLRNIRPLVGSVYEWR